MKRLFVLALTALSVSGVTAQERAAEWNTPSAGNPILPGYFADPTIRKFGDTYYIYATTDGTGNGYGPPQVWLSKDFVNWRNVVMNWPTTEVVWAPDVVQERDGSFRYYYCTPCVVRVGESQSPVGPWRNLLGRSDAVLVPDRFVPGAITLDPALFRDDDGSEYLYFGTWGIYKDFGCGVAHLSDDGRSFTDRKLIPNTEITDFFEAPYVFKRNGIYYFTYSSGSCHDDTYRVQYATSTVGPMGPYTYRGCILKSNADGTIHGPGHHSVLQDGDHYYIVYHRHNNPHAIHGFHRQVCIDEMQFDGEGNILPIVPTHEAVIPCSLAGQARRNRADNLAYGARVTASSFYNEWFRPEYAVDDNNGTLWRAGNAQGQAWLQLDLGKVREFNEIFTQFEYATFFYQYKIETSTDGRTWQLFANRLDNRWQGSPMVDVAQDYRERGVKGSMAKARYVRITITGRQKNGHFPAIWNVKIYKATKRLDPLAMLPDVRVDEAALVEGYPWIHSKDLEKTADEAIANGAPHQVLHLCASDYELGSVVDGIPVVPKDGLAAWRFDGSHVMNVDTADLHRLVYNAPYTVTAWVLNPDVDDMETVAQFMTARNDLATIELRNGRNRSEGIVAHNASFENAGAPGDVREGEWQHWAVCFDGFNERVYCNGRMVSEKNIFLMLRPRTRVLVGGSASGQHPFSGYLHELGLYEGCLDAEAVRADMNRVKRLTEAEVSLAAARTGLKGMKLMLNTRFLSPTVALATVCDAETGKPVEGVCLEYLFATGNDAGALKHAPVCTKPRTLLGVDGNYFYAQVRDVFNGVSEVARQRIDIPVNLFTDQATAIMEQADSTGVLRLESEDTELDADPSHNGPMCLQEVKGDFIMECRVAGMTGMDSHNTPAYNEGGIIIVVPTEQGGQILYQLGVFPNYNCGNMLTYVRDTHRPQFPNNKGWHFDPYLQLERRGSNVYARTSADRTTWTDMPGSPLTLDISDDTPVRAGIYQTTYSANHAYVDFDNVHIWTAIH